MRVLWLFVAMCLVSPASSWCPYNHPSSKFKLQTVPQYTYSLTGRFAETNNYNYCDGASRQDSFRLASTADDIQEWDTEELIGKLFNALVLIVCFGFASHAVVNIDHEITRGWTQQEIAMRIPLDNWASYESALAEKPILTKTFINVVIYSLGDWLSQTVFQKKNVLDFDAMRTLRNGFIGLCFGPLVHSYYEWSDHILPVEGGLFNRLRKILMDQTLYLTVKCSMYIAAVGILQGDDLKTVKDTIQDRILPICFTAWKFWPLIHCITYSVIPAQHRILWVNCVDLVWNAILAAMARKEEPSDEEIEVPSLAEAEIHEPQKVFAAVVNSSISNDTSSQERFSLEVPDDEPGARVSFERADNATQSLIL